MSHLDGARDRDRATNGEARRASVCFGVVDCRVVVDHLDTGVDNILDGFFVLAAHCSEVGAECGGNPGVGMGVAGRSGICLSTGRAVGKEKTICHQVQKAAIGKHTSLDHGSRCCHFVINAMVDTLVSNLTNLLDDRKRQAVMLLFFLGHADFVGTDWNSWINLFDVWWIPMTLLNSLKTCCLCSISQSLAMDFLGCAEHSRPTFFPACFKVL